MTLFSIFNFSTISTLEATSLNFSFSYFNSNNYLWISPIPPFLPKWSKSFKYDTSDYNFLTKASSEAEMALALALILTFYALFENINVLIVSSAQSAIGATVAIKQVLVFPPILSYNILVNFESR